MTRLLPACVIVGLVAMPAVARADVFFKAELTGAQEVPPSGSAGTGFGRVTLNESETQITATVYYSGLGSGVVLGHIHGPAGPGANAPVIFDLAPTTGATEGSVVARVFPITPSQVSQLKNGQLYFNIHTANFPNGEIRGQLVLDPALRTTLTGEQEVPGVGTSGLGQAFVSVNDAGTQALVSARWGLLSGPASAGHLHGGAPGVAGGIICDLAPPAVVSGEVFDRLCTLSPAQAALLRSGQFYVNLHTATYADGEIRGQLKRSWNPCDFDGDGKSDKVVVRTGGASLRWWVLRSSNGSIEVFDWGLPEDFVSSRVLCQDVDGDGKADATIWRSGPQSVFWTRLSSGGVRVLPWGIVGDDARMTGDYDGDGRDDYTIYRSGPQSRYWTLLSTTGGLSLASWGTSGDFPQSTPDYDGDGRTDVGVQQGTIFWTRDSSSGAIRVFPFGLSSDFQQAADFDGDGRSDIATSRISGTNRQWWIRSSLHSTPTTTATLSPFGTGFLWGSTAAPTSARTTADFDGDGVTDIGVYKASTGGPGLWWVINPKTGVVSIRQWGIDGDLPVQGNYWK